MSAEFVMQQEGCGLIRMEREDLSPPIEVIGNAAENAAERNKTVARGVAVLHSRAGVCRAKLMDHQDVGDATRILTRQKDHACQARTVLRLVEESGCAAVVL